MAKGEQEEVNQANVVSYFKSLTLEKKYGTTGAIEMEQGAVYIGKTRSNWSIDAIKSTR